MKKTIVTIDREYGSGGRAVGEKLAKDLGFKFYDRELLNIAAEESGLNPEMFEYAERRATSSLIFSFSSIGMAQSGVASPFSISMDDRVFLAQAKAIKKVAKEGSCVIVGACADYVLRNQDNVVNIFIHSDIDNRKQRAKEEYNLPDKNLENYIKKIDKARATYYVHYTDNKWGKSQNYDICLDTSIGIDETVEVLKKYIELRKMV